MAGNHLQVNSYSQYLVISTKLSILFEHIYMRINSVTKGGYDGIFFKLHTLLMLIVSRNSSEGAQK